jgi:ribonuclease G
MSVEILMNVTPSEVRVAMVENGVLQELAIERASRRGLVGSIFKGTVSRVLPGMQAAFVDIGLDRTAFLHVSDLVIPSSKLPGDFERASNEMRSESISELLYEGQDILVQVIKDPLGTKGARLTTQVSLPARFLVYIPSEKGVGISQKIEDETERQRLRAISEKLGQEFGGGYIVRTAAEGVSEEELRADALFFQKLWPEIQAAAKEAKAGTQIYEDLPLVVRTLRDRVHDELDRVMVDSKETYKKINKFASKFVPEIVNKLEYYPGERPLFDLYGIEDEIQRALERKVQLKSGGHLVIDQTEAMTTIDVNTGAFVGHRNLEETIFKTNLEAAQSIARQLRLRNLGGIIIIDFIDMADEEHKRQVLRALDKYLQKDKAKTKISGVSALGLVEMTRKRTQESLEHILCQPCPTCSGRGTLKTPETVCYEIFRDIIREARQFEAAKFMVLVSQEVADRLIDEESAMVAALEEFIGKPIKVQVESLYTQEQFDIVLL